MFSRVLFGIATQPEHDIETRLKQRYLNIRNAVWTLNKGCVPARYS